MSKEKKWFAISEQTPPYGRFVICRTNLGFTGYGPYHGTNPSAVEWRLPSFEELMEYMPAARGCSIDLTPYTDEELAAFKLKYL